MIHKIATFHSSEIGSTPRHQHYDNGEECPRLSEEKTQKLYHIPTWNAKTGKVEVKTLLRDETTASIDINEIGSTARLCGAQEAPVARCSHR